VGFLHAAAEDVLRFQSGSVFDMKAVVIVAGRM
jgi:hypothetical protein